MKKQNEYGAIYCIYNRINDKFYIGSSVDPNRRIREHLNQLKNESHVNKKPQNAFNKYGIENFTFEILCHEIVKKLLIKQQEFIDNLKPYYNISKSANAPMTGRNHSKETLERFKTRKTGKGIKKRAWSEEARKNHLKARIGKKRSEEFKERRRQESINDGRVKNFDREKAKKAVKDSLGNQFSSMVECSKFHEMSVQAVCDILKGRTKKSKKGITFEYA